MPVPSSNSHLKNTAGGSFTEQTQGGTIVGVTTATTIITKAISIKDINAADQSIYPGPKELSGATTYNTAKILSGGTFAYNAAKNGTWILPKVGTTLAGVAKDFLVFMANVESGPKFPYYIKDNYDNTTSLVRKNLFSRTGYDTSGNKIKERTTWVTSPTGTAGADFGTSGQIPTRAVPGELFILTNFVDYSVSTSSNYYNYPAITGK
jgi:hypothetical protein